MNKIADIFKYGKALITYITAGDPDLDFSEKIILELDMAGVDIIEVGIPFSDPLADGPTIQSASQRALENNVSLELILKSLKNIKERINSPIVLMGYYNSILNYGREKFVRVLKESGVSGIIIPDLPYDEDPGLYSMLKENGLAGILLVTPNTSCQRLQEISSKSTGFLYCVSLFGVTGDSRGLYSGINDYLKKVRKYIPDIPIALGFGIDSPQKVKDVIDLVDGVIIGSALIKTIAYSKDEDKIENAKKFVKEIKKVMN
jgi:tryptophan synthase alpha chain